MSKYTYTIVCERQPDNSCLWHVKKGEKTLATIRSDRKNAFLILESLENLKHRNREEYERVIKHNYPPIVQRARKRSERPSNMLLKVA